MRQNSTPSYFRIARMRALILFRTLCPPKLQFTVTVPEGGVKEGETFEVPYPEDDDDAVAVAEPAMVEPSVVEVDPIDIQLPAAPANTGLSPMQMEGGRVKENTGITGRWRTDLCSCCETCCCPFWIGCCCSGVLLGQVMQRFKLDACGRPGSSYESTCMVVSIITVVFNVILFVLGNTSRIGTVIWLALIIYLTIITTMTRIGFRRKYNIPAKCCGESCMDDCCCSFWCGICVICQLHRHTHDEREYPYELSSNTGLGSNAPEIV
mmetsp:Transcript_10689/g.30546  ORF Transcript_10689/g.30546 Transcript_10689/m.30546 type:complete len:266 (+) Transcript_10689:34-831(+)